MRTRARRARTRRNRIVACARIAATWRWPWTLSRLRGLPDHERAMFDALDAEQGRLVDVIHAARRRRLGLT